MAMQEAPRPGGPDDGSLAAENGRRRDAGAGEGRAQLGLEADREMQAANVLGWLSLGLGLAGIAAPGSVARLIGVRNDEGTRAVLRTVGFREIASGVGILTQQRPAGWVWSRVAGDMMDLALLGKALTSEDSKKERVAAAAAAVAGITALDVMTSQRLSRREDKPGNREIPRVRAITIRRTPEEVYRHWRDLRNLPGFMPHVLSIEEIDERRSHWRVLGPADTTIEWDAEITEDLPGERISWRTLPGSTIAHRGTVSFRPAPGDRGTEVRVELHYAPPAGVLGAAAARMFGREPKQELQDDLRILKQILETGEIVCSEATLRGSHLLQPPARPPEGSPRTEGWLPAEADRAAAGGMMQ